MLTPIETSNQIRQKSRSMAKNDTDDKISCCKLIFCILYLLELRFYLYPYGVHSLVSYLLMKSKRPLPLLSQKALLSLVYLNSEPSDSCFHKQASLKKKKPFERERHMNLPDRHWCIIK